MNLSIPNYKIVVNNNVFHIEKTTSKKIHSIFSKIRLIFSLIIDMDQKYMSTCKTLKDLENIIKKVKNGNLTYDDKRESDEMVGLTQQVLCERLKEIGTEIENSFEETTSKVKLIGRLFKLNSKKDQIHKIKQNIDTEVNAIRSKSIIDNDDHMLEISRHLDLEYWGILPQVSPESNHQWERVQIRRAKELGYIGEQLSEAQKYLQELSKQAAEFLKEEVDLPSNNSKNKLLENLRLLDEKMILQLLTKQKIYKCDKLKQCILHLLKLKVVMNKTVKKEAIEQKNLNREKNLVLYVAIEHNDYDTAEFILTHGAHPNTHSSQSKYVLHVAIEQKNLKIVQLLLARGANVNAQGVYGKTALLYACSFSSRSAPIVKLLLEYGADPNIPMNFGPIRTCENVYVGSLSDRDIARLLNFNPIKNDLTDKKLKPLDLALDEDHCRGARLNRIVIKLLLAHGANLSD